MLYQWQEYYPHWVRLEKATLTLFTFPNWECKLNAISEDCKKCVIANNPSLLLQHMTQFEYNNIEHCNPVPNVTVNRLGNWNKGCVGVFPMYNHFKGHASMCCHINYMSKFIICELHITLKHVTLKMSNLYQLWITH